MKYKIGDKVKIKKIDGFSYPVEEYFKKHSSERILTIKEIDESITPSYLMKEIDYRWKDYMIECLVKEYKEPELKPILSRFEILDIRE